MSTLRKKVVFSILAILIAAVAIGTYYLYAMNRPGFWEPSIRKFEAADRVNPPNQGCIVFTGSSSITFWKSVSDDMKPLDVVNRGFGGSQISQVNEYLARIVLPYHPRAVVLYAGENDLSFPASKKPDEVIDDFEEFVETIHDELPETWIYYVSMKPTPLRWKNWPTLAATNQRIEEFCRTQDRCQYIDVSAAMLDASGNPRKDLYRADRLHMNAQGYAIWISIIKPILIARFAPSGPQNVELR